MNDEIRVIKKNVAPLESRNALRKFTLALNIKRYTTDSNGAILDNAAVPASEQKAFPFHLFGEFDRQSGYAIADTIAREKSNTNLFGVYVVGISTPLFYFNPIATVNNQLKKGDVVFIYVDDVTAPNIFTFIVVSAQQGGYASLAAQSNVSQIDDNGHWGVFKFFDVRYAWFDDEQLSNPIFLVQTKFNSAFKYDTIDPLAYRYIQQKTDVRVLAIPLEVTLNQYIGLTSFIAFENSVLNLSFNLYL